MIKKLKSTQSPLKMTHGGLSSTCNPIIGNGVITTGTTTTTLNGSITTGGYYYPNNTNTTTTNTLSWGDGVYMNSDIIEYIDIFYQFMGIDMNYKRFSEMSKSEKKGFIRDLKLKKLIDDK